jgi:hypothetical protein
LPLLGGPRSEPAEADARLERVEERSGLRRGDLREIVFAWQGTDKGWVLVLGGIFHGAEGMAVLAQSLQAESPTFRPASDGRTVVDAASGVAVGRAPSLVLVAPLDAELRRALEPGTAYETLGLPLKGPGAIAVGQAGLRALAQLPGLEPPELIGIFGLLDEVTASLELGERMTVHVRLSAARAGDAARAARELLALMKAHGHDGPDSAGQLFSAAADRSGGMTQPDDRTAELALAWDREEADQGMGLLARAIRRAFAPGGQ